MHFTSLPALFTIHVYNGTLVYIPIVIIQTDTIGERLSKGEFKGFLGGLVQWRSGRLFASPGQSVPGVEPQAVIDVCSDG